MPAVDKCQKQIENALQKDGWQINQTPYYIYTTERIVFIDIEAIKQINGKEQHILLAEVKCFTSVNNLTTEVYVALGQYIAYRAMLDELNVSVPLYLAIPSVIYAEFDRYILRAIREHRIKLIVVKLDEEQIDLWIE